MSELIKVDHLSKSFWNVEEEEKSVFKDVSFSIKENEIVGIMGKSGCGKTTLLKIIGLLENASEGDVFIRGKSVESMNAEERSKLRRSTIGFIFQDYMLLDSLSVEDNILLPLLIDNSKDPENYDKVYQFGESLGISDIMKCYPRTLSGGEKQRVAICRALINNPDLILADEPTGNLDEEYRKTVMEEIMKIKQMFHKTIIIVTHDSYVASYCDRVFYLDKGRIKSIN